MEHSRLLKFLVADTLTLSKMAEAVKIKFDYQDPENVEAEVPGSQKIREAQTDETITNNDNAGETSKTNGENSKESSETKDNVPKEEDVVTKEDEVETRQRRRTNSGKRNGIHGEPVLFAEKLDDKKSKTKIPISRFRQTVEKVKKERRLSKEKSDLESHIPVRRSSIPKPVKDSKLPQTATKKEITITKSSTKNNAAHTTTNTLITETSEAFVNKETTAVEAEDEFDKLYAEVINDTPTEVILDDSLLNPKVEDPEKLDSKFEEIIHNYEEHKVEPIDVEVVRRSKLPQLKRKSQQEFELNAQAERTSKIIAARDKLRFRHSLNKDQDFEKALDEELNKEFADIPSNVYEVNINNSEDKNTPQVDIKTETKHEIVSSPNSKTETISQFTKTISTCSPTEIENTGSCSVIEISTVKEITNIKTKDTKKNELQFITEDNIMKDSIKIGIPVFESYTHEFLETNETEKSLEIKKVLSYTNESEELSVSNTFSETKNGMNTKNKMSEINLSTLERDNNVSERSNNEKTELTNSSCVHVYKSEDFNIGKSKSEHLEDDKRAKVQHLSSLTRDPKEATDISTKETEIEVEVQLRGKVDKLVSKIDSKEIIEIEGSERESINELRKKKAVLSKIAIFERKPEEDLCKATKKELRPPKLITKDWQKVETAHIHTPLIVEEVFKPFQTNTSLNLKENKDENSLKDVTEVTNISTESIFVKSYDSVSDANENKVQVEYKTVQEKPVEVISQQSIPLISNNRYIPEKNEIQAPKLLNESKVEEPPTASIKFNEFNFKQTTNKDIEPPTANLKLDEFDFDQTANKKKEPLTSNIEIKEFDFKQTANKDAYPTKLNTTKELQSPVVIPGFKPVRALLKSFESKHDTNTSHIKRSVSKEQSTNNYTRKVSEISVSNENKVTTTQISHNDSITSEYYDDFEIINDYKSLDDVFPKETDDRKVKLRQDDELKRAKSLAELDIGDAVKGKVNNMILRIKSMDRTEHYRSETINKKELPRKLSVSEKIALFEVRLCDF